MSTKKLAVFATTLAGVALAPQIAEAYKTPTHIAMANQIRDELRWNWAGPNCSEKEFRTCCSAEDPWCGKPAIRLLGGDGTKFVVLPEEDAQAIVDHPLYWRGGAIGPDNTVFVGLTDPSHAWQFFPFAQCAELVRASKTPEERAYALGCYLHGITDNNVHHIVNYFTGETFTLYPKDGAKDGELKFNLLNVVRHMVVEGKIQEAFKAHNPGAFTRERLEHKIATDLYLRVYLTPQKAGVGLWDFFAGKLVAQKNDALNASHLDGLDPTTHLDPGMTIEELTPTSINDLVIDGKLMAAYVDFLKHGGNVQILDPGGLAPHDRVFMLPEIVKDVQRYLYILQRQGELKAAAGGSQDPVGFYKFLFATEDGKPSHFNELRKLKAQELDRVLVAYIETVERLSNVVVQGDIGAIGVAYAFEPLVTALDDVTEFPINALVDAWLADKSFVVRQAVGLVMRPMSAFLTAAYKLTTSRFKEFIVDELKKFTEELKQQLLELSPQAIQDLHAKVHELRDIVHAQIDATKLAALGLDLSDADSMFENFGSSVLYMNSINSIAGVLANRELAFSTESTGFFEGGAVSFDASFQVSYNQMAVCEDLREAFYPCGTSALEVLQGDFKNCQAFDVDEIKITPEMEPNVECHNGSAVEFSDEPEPEHCQMRELDDIVSPDEGHRGSYTLAHPPALSRDSQLACRGLTVPGLAVAGDGKQDDVDADGTGEEPTGCSCTTGDDPGFGGVMLFSLFALGLRRRWS